MKKEECGPRNERGLDQKREAFIDPKIPRLEGNKG
jgi:hypothetical protein